LGGEGWEPLAGFRATARSEDELIDAIEELSRNIREKAGESLRSVQSAPPLDQVTTASLEALRTYTRAETLEGEGDREAALELYERAVAIDPSFAMAYRKVGVALSNMGIRREDEIAANTRAFELRERLPQREQLQAEAYYHWSVTGDRDAAIRVYESLLEIDPDDVVALNNLAISYRNRDRLEESERLVERAVAVEPFTVAFINLATTRARMGRPGPAEAALDSGIARLPRAAFAFEQDRVELAASLSRYEAADSMIAAYATRFRGPDALRIAAQLRFRLDAVRGRLRLAEESLEDFGVASGFWTNPMSVAYLRSSLALFQGDSATAARIALDAHDRFRDSLPPGDRRYFLTIRTLLEAGKRVEAEQLVEEWQELVPDDALGVLGRDNRRGTRARLAFTRGDYEEAARLWEAHRRECPGWPPCALNAAQGLARIHEEAGDAAAAIVEYERLLSEPYRNRFWFDARQRGPTLERLGQLYDEAADLENAAKWYAMFVELWRDADPELQPRVEAAQQRLNEIFAERG
jgi:tetratricopeptide (TPR) repeat protein